MNIVDRMNYTQKEQRKQCTQNFGWETSTSLGHTMEVDSMCNLAAAAYCFVSCCRSDDMTLLHTLSSRVDRMHCISLAKDNQLMLFKDISLYCENDKRYKSTLCKSERLRILKQVLCIVSLCCKRFRQWTRFVVQFWTSLWIPHSYSLLICTCNLISPRLDTKS